MRAACHCWLYRRLTRKALERDMNDRHYLLITTASNLEGLLLQELDRLGAEDLRETRGGVHCAGPVELAHRICLWSRLASRVLLPLGTVAAADADELYRGVRGLDWESSLKDGVTLAVTFSGTSRTIRHTVFGAQRVKDAILDRLRQDGRHARVDLESPDIRISVRLHGDRAQVALDLAGESLHRRGYRRRQTEAPLKESLAAAVLLRGGWPGVAGEGGTLFDPCCGSGTLLIEGAMMAADIAPGLWRQRYGFLAWRGHDGEGWRELLNEAEGRRRRGLEHLPPIVGHDRDRDAVAATCANLAACGLDAHIVTRCAALEDEAVSWPDSATGLLATNPPYGHRLEANAPVERLYMALGDRARRTLPGWHLAVLTSRSERLAALGLRAERVYRLFNGRLPARLGTYLIGSAASPRRREDHPPEAPTALVNRLRKNDRHLARWRRRERVGCYRVYDADIPEYAFAIDVYDTDRGRRLHVQEYEPPAKIAPRKAELRRREALAAVQEGFDVTSSAVHFKMRRRRRAAEQHGPQARTGEFLQVHEGDCLLRVNLADYLDTGLFLDHRPLRQQIGQAAAGRRFLNLFGYTGSATVHAAVGGARATTTVDLSRRYLEWARENLRLNGLDDTRHELVAADVRQWLADAATPASDGGYDLILLDPPTSSRSRRMATPFDVQRDHVELIHSAARLLAQGGVLYFSNNSRNFRLHGDSLADLEVEEITRETIAPDFARGRPIHRCWRIRRPR